MGLPQSSRQSTAHNPIGWELQQLVKSGQYPDETAVLRSALRALYQLHPETKTRMVSTAYTSGEISLGRAASMLGVSLAEAEDILRESGVEIHLGPTTAEELATDINHA